MTSARGRETDVQCDRGFQRVSRGGGHELYVLEKRGGKVVRRAVLPVRFVPMTGRAKDGLRPAP